MRFFDLVQSAAESNGKVFFLWAGEGHDLITDEIDCEDLSGWLVDESDAARFERIWLDDWSNIPDDLDDTFCFARWSNDGGAITVHFE
jgi:hypothetical protein